MTLNDVLLSLLEDIGTTGETCLIGWDAVQQWPDSAIDRLLEVRIITTAKPTSSIECRECENRCFMEVYRLSGEGKKPARAFVICDDPEKQDQMGRIEIPLDRLQQWKVTVLQLAKVIAGLVGVECKADDRHGKSNIRIGMIKGKNGMRWLLLNKTPLALEINDHCLALEEVLFFEDDVLAIDQVRIEQLIDKAPGSSGKKYQPSAERREARKRKTEAMYEDWRNEYLALKKKRPNMSDVWYSQQIARMKCSQGKQPETIRKQMKK